MQTSDQYEAQLAKYITLTLRTESPIEKSLLLALIEQMRTHASAFRGTMNFMGDDFTWRAPMADSLDGLDLPEGDFIFWLQAKILFYRVDFLMLDRRGPRPLWYVIECDGHEFHERTKEQAQHDRLRDRSMTAVGLRVFRYTGSEITRNPMACAVEFGTYLDMSKVDGN